MTYSTRPEGPVISVIIPCFNYSQYIPQALKSLQAQTLKAWECWVIDDGSTDLTADIVKNIASHDERIRYIYQKNQGQAAARNTGLQYARGNYIQFLDADDLLQPMKLDIQSKFLDEHAEVNIVYGNVRYFTDSHPQELFLSRWDKSTDDWMPKISGKSLTIIQAYIKQNIFELGCALFRSEVIRQVGTFNVALQGVEDYDFCFRCAMAGLGFAYLEKSGSWCLMRHHTSSFSKNLFHMYRKELMMRDGMMQSLKQNCSRDLVDQNRKEFNFRLKKLQNLMIDDTIKGRKNYVGLNDMKWMYSHSSAKQNLYFFPRILKAYFTSSLLNNH